MADYLRAQLASSRSGRASISDELEDNWRRREEGRPLERIDPLP